MKRIFMVFIMVFLFIACDGGNTKIQTDKTGEENFPCFANDTCNDNLVCVDDVCIKELSNDTDDIELQDDIEIDDSVELDDDEIPDSNDTEIEDIEIQDEKQDDIEIDDSVELDDDEIPDENIGDIYNCFNDTRYFYYNGDCWLKQENFILYQKVFDETTPAFDIMDDIRNECSMIGGRVPTIMDFRKNVFKPEYCQMAINVCANQCMMTNDTLVEKYSKSCVYDAPVPYNDFIYPNSFKTILNNIYLETSLNMYNIMQFNLETTEYSSKLYVNNIGIRDIIRGVNLYNITCIKNI